MTDLVYMQFQYMQSIYPIAKSPKIRFSSKDENATVRVRLWGRAFSFFIALTYFSEQTLFRMDSYEAMLPR